MSPTTELLIEIGTEELPPAALQPLALAFTEGLRTQLTDAEIAFSSIESFASPRRLALLVHDIQTQQPDREVVRRGPAVQAAFTADGAPTKAALGFASSCGVALDALARESTPKGEWLLYREMRPGAPTAALVPTLTETALAGLPIPRRMRWGTGTAEFVRPVHWVCLLLGRERVPGTILGVASGRVTFGHRFHHPEALPIAHARDYADLLRSQGFVEPDFIRRRERIQTTVMELAATQGLTARLDPDLLNEVTALVEWPVPILGHFDESYLEIPPEVLIETMQSHQKYFPLEDQDGRLQAAFIAVTNLESRDPDQVRAGNERVIRPRFADAAFFWRQDLKQPLESYRTRLETVVFQERLGSLADKSARVACLARHLAPTLQIDPEIAARAALLSRCDLVTSMVYEFPTLQGTMGRYYAAQAQEDAGICEAMQEQYLPRFAGDRLPLGACGRTLAIADRIDTLVGVFGIGLRPSGAKDPYGLRRAAIGVLRILIESPLDLDLRDLLAVAASIYPAGTLSADVEPAALEFLLERLRGYYHDRGIAADTIEAVLRTGVTNPADLDARLTAVSAFRRLPAAVSLAAANKRIRNLLTKSGIQVGAAATQPQPRAELFVDPAEMRLGERVARLSAQVHPLASARDYVGVLEALADLDADLDAFFEAVLVMDEDETIRDNRLALLASLASLFLLVADLSRVQDAPRGT
ncbi:glycine--tRNA ligase subunit beta [Thiocapsa imhoffii]|uniref:Glycine--tRNA ligase beta subunit n=1 Tax=Thiocapsa imhoffii TaxID=382777 RepID=A0A9X1B8P6_9GAMM|nr:glycine--tRNA ligase subunit beta [Thiocapsa imhoffii]